MPKSIDLTGRVYTYLEVLYLNDRPYKEKHWACRCKCGNIISTTTGHLNSGHTRSCGCLQKETVSSKRSKHREKYPKVYGLWKNIKNRCYNTKAWAYKYYGGRGINLFEYWINNHEKFIDYVITLENYGDEGYSLDRINNDGNYEPDNLRWATKAQQSRNTRFNTVNEDIVKDIRELKGLKTNKEIAEIFGLSLQHVKLIIKEVIWKNL